VPLESLAFTGVFYFRPLTAPETWSRIGREICILESESTSSEVGRLKKRRFAWKAALRGETTALAMPEYGGAIRD
jgi:hypothetical protein